MYSGVFTLIIGLIVAGNSPTQDVTSLARANSVASTQAGNALPTPALNDTSVDKLVATRVAANIAESVNLPVARNVANLSQSLAAESVLVKDETSLVAKPQIVQPTATQREVKKYTAVAGDTVQKVAEKYGVSADTIKWANNLASDAVDSGKELTIPPVDGVVYTVKDGDTIEKLTEKYKTDKAQAIAFNDLEVGGLSVGKQIVLPGGVVPEKERPDYVAPVQRTVVPRYATTPRTSGGSATANYYSASVGNRYAFGNCTWYAYERRAQLGRPIGSFWGNAATWAAYARSAGFKVDRSPAPGSIMQNGGGWGGYGHVAIVESVQPGVSVTISEMNGYRFGGGFNRIGRGTIDWASATSGAFQYIH